MNAISPAAGIAGWNPPTTVEWSKHGAGSKRARLSLTVRLVLRTFIDISLGKQERIWTS
jgi:hypothetical protein